MAYRDFTSLEAVRRLHLLAENPHDLTSSSGLAAARLEKYRASAQGFDLLFAGERVNDEVLIALQDLADEAELVAQFLAMKKGEVVNRIAGYPSENRQALHTASRDLFSAAPDHGEATARAKEQLERLRHFLAELEAGRITNQRGESFTTIVQVGIGGSDLGPRALYLALQRYRLAGREARFIANVDPDDAAEVLRGLDLSRTLVNVVSKSGATLETLTNEELVRAAFEKAGLESRHHFLAVTGEGSPLDDPSRYLASFHMYDYIGGRYSSTSMVGAVTLAFTLGYDNFLELLRGASDMDHTAEQPDIWRNPPLLMALLGIWNRNFLGHETVAVLPYSQALSRFAAHLQQCDMESNGKAVTRNGQAVQWHTGPILWGEPGTNGQHAFYQLLHQGTTVVPVEFIGFRRSQYEADLVINGTTSQQKLVANMLAQSLALAQGSDHANPNKRFAGNRPSLVLLGEQLTPYAMGALLALYESRIVFQGFCWNINSFDQEGVQLGKVLATRLLREIESEGSETGDRDREEETEYRLLTVANCLKQNPHA